MMISYLCMFTFHTCAQPLIYHMSSAGGMYLPLSSGVICETQAHQAAVIPAKAGIHSASVWK
jgi:hypothetical protein